MRVHLVDELVEVVFVALAQVDEGLHRLVRVGGDVLLAAFVDDLSQSLVEIWGKRGEMYLNHVVDEYCEVCDAVVDVC